MTCTRTLLLAALAGALALTPANAQTRAGAQTGLAAPLELRGSQPASAASLAGAERDTALAAVSRSLNAVQMLQGRFVQRAPNGVLSTGDFYIQRPGRMRLDYENAPLLIVADARNLYVRDRELRTTERTTLNSTPFYVFLKENIDIARDARITRVAREGPDLLVTARDRTGTTDGAITLRFEGAGLDLRAWEVTDATGARTEFYLSEITHPQSLDRRLFRLEDMLDTGRHGPR